MNATALRTLVGAALMIAMGACGSTDLSGLAPPPARDDKASSVMTESPNPVPEDVMTRILDEVSRASGVSRDNIIVERAERVTWNDGALGCPQPNVEYLQQIIDGFWVVLHAGAQEFDYRIDDRLRFVRCTGATRRAPIVGPPDR